MSLPDIVRSMACYKSNSLQHRITRQLLRQKFQGVSHLSNGPYFNNILIINEKFPFLAQFVAHQKMGLQNVFLKIQLIIKSR
jgi:hypothetical protein